MNKNGFASALPLAVLLMFPALSVACINSLEEAGPPLYSPDLVARGAAFSFPFVLYCFRRAWVAMRSRAHWSARLLSAVLQLAAVVILIAIAEPLETFWDMVLGLLCLLTLLYFRFIKGVANAARRRAAV